MMNINKKIFLLLFFAAGLILFSCQKKYEPNYSGAYQNPPVNPYQFIYKQGTFYTGAAGDVLKFKVTGLDSLLKVDPTEVAFYINGSKTVVQNINAADSSVSLVIPPNTSSGAVTLVVKSRIIYGPMFRMNGYVWIDSSFRDADKDQLGRIVFLKSGPNERVQKLFLDGTNLYIMGNFTDYNNLGSYARGATSYLLRIDPGTSLIKTDFLKDAGPNAPIAGMLRRNSNLYFIYGGSGFTSYSGHVGPSNITGLMSNGMLDSINANVVGDVVSVPSFMGGFNSAVLAVFNDSKGRIVAIGNFNAHLKNNYGLSYPTSIFTENTYMRNVAAMDLDGNLDRTYNYDATRGQVLKGTDKSIADAVQISTKKIIIVGDFTKYNNANVNRIAMLDDNGQADPSFTASANGPITRITYNATLKKMMVIGTFTQFNGQPAPYGLAMINESGVLDPTFQLGTFEQSRSSTGQVITYAAMLDNGNVIVSGAFERYKPFGTTDFVTRQGFMILSPTGALAPNLNNTGAFQGQIFDMVEYNTTNPTRKGVILAGKFDVFDNTNFNNLIKIGLEAK